MSDPDRTPVLTDTDLATQTRMERWALMASYYLSQLQGRVPEALAYQLVADWHASELTWEDS